MKGYGEDEEEEEDEERGVLKDEERELRNVSLRKRSERMKTLFMNMSSVFTLIHLWSKS